MSILGAHMSISGGYYKAVDAAAELGMQTVQLFTKNNNQWQGKPILPAEIKLFKESLERGQITNPLSHASYLINLASPDDVLWQKSIDAMVIELQRAEALGIPYVVVHPGSYTTSSVEEGIARVSQALDIIHAQTEKLTAICLLENTAGQGSNLGSQFEELAAMIAGCKSPSRVGVCFDTCHALAAGYPQSTEEDFQATWKKFKSNIGLEKLKAIHVNDSKKGLGSRVDRHEQLGHGHLGPEAFRLLMQDQDLLKIPMYLETPKDDNDGEPWDATNLRFLRSFLPSAKTK